MPKLITNEKEAVLFLTKELENYTYDSQNPNPTYGLTNYLIHIASAKRKTEDNLIFMPERVKPYFKRVTDFARKFEMTLYGLKTSLQETSAIEHILNLENLIHLYSEGYSLTSEAIPDSSPELEQTVNLTRGQLILTEHLFDSNKRQNPDFKFKFWGNPNDFIGFIENLDRAKYPLLKVRARFR